MTLYAWARPRHFPRLPPPVDRYFAVAPDACVLARCHWQADRHARTTLIALHGLEGSSDAHYMQGLADKAFARGLNVVRLNQRNCGGTERLSMGLYHSGLTADVHAVIRELRSVDQVDSFAVAGYSLGGNLAVRLAGEVGTAPDLRAVSAVSPTLDLAASVAAIERPENRLYQWNFMRNLRGRMRRKARAFPDRYRVNGLSRVRTIREFDERFTAPHHGFRDAADYYHRASALRVVGGVRVPTLIIAAEDDPFVPVSQFREGELAANPSITTLLTRHGGHCGFVGPANGQDDGYWAETAVVDFISRQPARAAGPARA
jgi:hypothetical protein